MCICIGNKNYEIIQNLDNFFSSNELLLVKEKEREDYCILSYYKNLSEKQVEGLSNYYKFNNRELEKDDNNNYYIKEYYKDDKSLRTLINEHKQEKKFIEETIFEIICGICIRLKILHDQNMSHLNLKPENIFIYNDNDIIIYNFRINKSISRNKFTLDSYTSPEMIINENINNKTDIWSLGILFMNYLL